jgi:mycothiol system anti-sigma-R factor
MSCGNHHDTDCSEVLAEVWLFLDHECDDGRRRLLAQHLDECEPCLSEYGIDEKLKRLLAAKSPCLTSFTPRNAPILPRGFMEPSTDREAASGVHPE